MKNRVATLLNFMELIIVVLKLVAVATSLFSELLAVNNAEYSQHTINNTNIHQNTIHTQNVYFYYYDSEENSNNYECDKKEPPPPESGDSDS